VQNVPAFWDKLAIARNGRGNVGAALQTLATRSVIFTLNIGTGVLTARVMGAEGRGLLAALLTWPQFIAYLTTFGLTASLMYNVKTSPLERGRFLGAALCLVAIAGCLACLAGIALMPWMLPGYGADQLATARLLMATAPVILLALAVQTAAEAAGDFPGANALRGLSVVGTLAGIVSLASAGTLTPASAALCYLLPQAPIGVWLFLRLRRGYAPTLHRFGQTSRRLIGYGLRCYPIELLNTALTYAGQAMVITLLAAADVGYFNVAIGVGRILEVIYTTVATVLLPATAGQHPASITERTMRAARLTLFLMILALVPMALAIPVIMPLVYGPDFANAVSIARLLLLESALSGAVWVMLQAFLALGRPEYPTILQIAALVISVSSLLLVVPGYGAVGAAAVLVGVAVLKLALAVALYRVVLKVPMRQMPPSVEDVRYVRALLRR
jgi:O-antigen/teichoic acid export membrane protein